MKKITFALFIAFIAISISSCKKDSTNNPTNTIKPVAAFSLSPTTVNIGQEFGAINESTNSESYKWEINGVEYSTSENLYYLSLDSAGTYSLKLTAFNSNGNSNSITKTITVVNQYLAYAGTWDITERMQSYPYYNTTYVSNISFDNRGNASFTKYSEYEVPTTLNAPNNSYSTHHIDNYIVDLGYNAIINSSINFTTSGSQKQFTGNVRYYTGSSYDYDNDISGIKR